MTSLLKILIISVILIIVAVSDVRYRRIPNIFSLSVIVFGMMFMFKEHEFRGLLSSFAGMSIGGCFFIIFYFMGGMGAGDVKLMAGVGAVVGQESIVQTIFYVAVIGAIMAIIQIIMIKGQKHLAKKHVPFDSESMEQPIRSSAKVSSFQESKYSLPYGLAISLGTLISLFSDYLKI